VSQGAASLKLLLNSSKQFITTTHRWDQCSLRKFYTEQMFVMLRTKRMQLRNHADTQTAKRSQRWKGYAKSIYTAFNLECW